MVDHPSAGLGRSRIEHIIVLMMENRSFDHLLGYVQHQNERYPSLAEIQPSCPVNPNRPNGKRIWTTPDASSVLGRDPDHSHQAVMLQMFGRQGTPGVGTPTMTGFIASYKAKITDGTLRPRPWWLKVGTTLLTQLKSVWRRVRRRPGPAPTLATDIMKCFPESEIPVMAFLAKQFAVLTDWHASVPGETWPNRQFAHAATSHGTVNIEVDFYEDATIFERLTEADQSWEIYHDGVAQVWAYPKLWLSGTEHFHDISKLYEDIQAGALPAYAFVEPNHGYGKGEGNSQHPGNNMIEGDGFEAGEALIARIYNSLEENRDLFAKTLLLITYDEHGGFFDHMPPRVVVPPDDQADHKYHFDFSLSGVRVPAVAISPLIPAGTVDDTWYEHSSIPATIRRQFAPTTEPLTRRDTATNDLLDHLPLLPEPRTDLQPIPTRELATAVPEMATDRTLNDFQASLVDLAGAVHSTRRRAIRAESVGPPQFVPDPSTHMAAKARVLVPGSRADEVIESVVADFGREGSGPDPADVEFGNVPS